MMTTTTTTTTTTNTTVSTPNSINEAGPSKPRSSLICSICDSQPSKYTCPRCQIKTCSLPCSRIHKTTAGCSGERDRTAYVPMNRYGYAALMNDYVFLEEMGRKVENWGQDIVQSGLDLHAREGRGMTRMRRRGKDRKGILVMQLSIRDVDMDILPTGMKRASMNSSYWDTKAKGALLTIEFVFQPPPDPLSRQGQKPVSIITHKKDWEQTIREVLHTSIQETKKIRGNERLLDWLNVDEDETIPSSVLCLMKKSRYYDDRPDQYPDRPAYYKLDWNEKLSKALRHKHFVEFPTILLVDETAFDGVLVDESGVAEDMRERRTKRRKLNTGDAKKTLSSLVGAYGSEEEEEEEKSDVLETLADYSESESGENAFVSDEDVVDDTGDEETNDMRDTLDSEVVASDLSGENCNQEEPLDWGDDELAEDEAKIAELSAAIQQRYASR